MILWTSGEADASWASKKAAQVAVDHYEITSLVGLQGCIGDLYDRLITVT